MNCRFFNNLYNFVDSLCNSITVHLYIKHYTLCTGVVNVAEREQKCLIRSSRKVFNKTFENIL